MASDTRDVTPEDVVNDPGEWAILHQSRLLAELAELRRKSAAYDEIVDMAVEFSGYGYVRADIAFDGSFSFGAVVPDGE